MMRIFESYTFSGLRFKNRILCAATNDYSGASDGSVTDRQIDLYSKLAKNNVSGIITANYCVNNEGRLDQFQNSIAEDWNESRLRKIPAVLHMNNTRMIMQIAHAGSKSKINSRIAEKYADLNNITENEFIKIAYDFISAAYRAKCAGVDAVEVHCGHGYLLSDLLNGKKNNRDGLYGGEIRNRAKLVIEIVRGIHNKCGSQFPVWIKINCNDFSINELVIFCEIMKNAGVSAIEFSGNDFTKFVDKEYNYYQKQAAYIREKIEIPVILTGGIRSVEHAQDAINAGIDMVAMSRPFISEPEIVKKWREGRKSRCLSCNKCFHLYLQSGKRCVFHS